MYFQKVTEASSWRPIISPTDGTATSPKPPTSVGVKGAESKIDVSYELHLSSRRQLDYGGIFYTNYNNCKVFLGCLTMPCKLFSSYFA